MQNKKNKGQGKALPMKTIVSVIVLLFITITIGFMIIPSYFDYTPFGKLFNNKPAPWAISKEEQSKINFSEIEAQGKYHYTQYCASCHGPEGKGNGPLSIRLKKRPPNFTNPSEKYVNGFNETGILKTLNEGVMNTEMPAFNFLSTEIKHQISSYLQYIEKNQN